MFKVYFIFFLFLANFSFAGSMKSIGEKGNPDDVTREINVKMYDNYYEPSQIVIKKNETVKFIVKNYGNLVHEYNIATKEMHLKHQDEMAKMVEHEILLSDRIDKKKMKEVSKKHHEMSHNHSNSLLLEPNQTGVILWQFSTTTTLEAACNVPGHYESGMVAKIIKE